MSSSTSNSTPLNTSSIPNSTRHNGGSSNKTIKEEEPRIKKETSLPPLPSAPLTSIPSSISTKLINSPITSTSTITSSQTPFPGQVNAKAGPSSPPIWEKELNLINKKRKWGLMGYDNEEVDYLEEECLNLHLGILLDQTSTLYPPPPTRFTSYEDVVDRLLPYHIWQVHDEELEGQGRSEQEELNEIKDAQELVDRIKNVKSRFGKARRREGDWPSHLPSLINIYQQSNQITKEEISSLQSVLRPLNAEYTSIENEWKKIEDEKRRIEQIRLKKIEDEKRKKIEEEKKKKFEENQRKFAEEEYLKRVKKVEELRKQKEVEERQKSTLGQPSQPNPLPTPASGQNPPRTSTTANGSLLIPPPAATATTTAQPIPLQSQIPTTPAVFSPPNQPHTATPQTYRAHPVPSTPSTPSTASIDRGKPRGRPRGRGRGGTRESSVSHLPGQSNDNGVNTPSPASSSTALPPPASSTSAPGTPGAQPAGPSITNKGPVNLTVALSLIPQLVALGLLIIPTTPTTPKTPANIVKTLEDRKSVIISVDLGQCTKNQLLQLARLLNVSTKPPTGNGTATTASPSPAPAPAPAPTSTSSAGGTSSQSTQALSSNGNNGQTHGNPSQTSSQNTPSVVGNEVVKNGETTK